MLGWPRCPRTQSTKGSRWAGARVRLEPASFLRSRRKPAWKVPVRGGPERSRESGNHPSSPQRWVPEPSQTLVWAVTPPLSPRWTLSECAPSEKRICIFKEVKRNLRKFTSTGGRGDTHDLEAVTLCPSQWSPRAHWPALTPTLATCSGQSVTSSRKPSWACPPSHPLTSHPPLHCSAYQTGL